MEKWSQTLQTALISLLNIRSAAFHMYIKWHLTPPPKPEVFQGGKKGIEVSSLIWAKLSKHSLVQKKKKKKSGRET